MVNGISGTSCNILIHLSVFVTFVYLSVSFSMRRLQRLHGCLNEIVSLWGSPWISALDSFPLLRKLPNPPFSRLLKEVARRDDIIRTHLDEYKMQAPSKTSEEAIAITSALLNGLGKPQDTTQGVVLTDTHVHMATVDLLIGGTETTAAWLSWTVAFLLHRPEVHYRTLYTTLHHRTQYTTPQNTIHYATLQNSIHYTTEHNTLQNSIH
ncbi:unnamed protein product [Oncorhynchus mykiss]|uniref:Uncharacterized protein n=1 Tax=Oncorhynchus mykiss TaxID=8022 RepID=A0A060ZCF0_ONCMY|nr:unnamed protein product [Oncorhynchus mykiss]